MRGADTPREAIEAGFEAYEDQLNKCARGEHPIDAVSWDWDYYGNDEVPGGTVTFKTFRCGFCHGEWAS